MSRSCHKMLRGLLGGQVLLFDFPWSIFRQKVWQRHGYHHRYFGSVFAVCCAARGVFIIRYIQIRKKYMMMSIAKINCSTFHQPFLRVIKFLDSVNRAFVYLFVVPKSKNKNKALDKAIDAYESVWSTVTITFPTTNVQNIWIFVFIHQLDFFTNWHRIVCQCVR